MLRLTMPAPEPQALDAPTLIRHLAPLMLAVSAFAAPRLRHAASWRLALSATGGALLAAAAAVIAALAGLLPGGAAATNAAWPLTQGIVLLLIAAIGMVITRYSATYLDGERDQPRFAGWLLATLAGSTLVVATDHLLVLLVAWLATSLCLQNLLTFYPERLNAQLAARKKFLVSRTADLCVLAATLLLADAAGTLQIDAIFPAIAAAPSTGADVAVLLLVVAVLLKSAQLPFHGWLMQVMEAPTPVSALLHAGVVNLGGYVLVRTGELLAHVPAAQVLLVVVGGTTAALAGLAATTQTNAKGALAWSTCAQMGFMLLQCGLGLYAMALLHLVAHSIYKSHCFLSAGSAAQRTRIARIGPRAAAMPAAARVAAAVATTALLWLLCAAIAPTHVDEARTVVLLVLLGCAATSLLDPRAVTASAGRAAAFAAGWLLLHLLISRSPIAPLADATPWLAALAAAVLLLPFAVELLHGHERLPRLQRWLHGGMSLDDWFTRLTLRVFRWRPRAARGEHATAPTFRTGESR